MDQIFILNFKIAYIGYREQGFKITDTQHKNLCFYLWVRTNEFSLWHKCNFLIHIYLQPELGTLEYNL